MDHRVARRLQAAIPDFIGPYEPDLSTGPVLDDATSTNNKQEVIPMYASYLQIRADEIQAELFREAANWRLAREARAARSSETLMNRIRRALAPAARTQASVASASATSCTP
jgi:hypothetical protein